MSDLSALTVPPPGWYPDRNEAAVVRWWDGQQWTNQTQSTAPAAAAFEQSASAASFAAAAVATPTAPTDEIAPGWYPDNADPSFQRWWDGVQWTTHTTPTLPAVQPGVAQFAGAQYSAAQYSAAQYAAEPVSSRSNSMATLSLIISIVSFAGLIFVELVPLALAGIIIGGVALRRAQRYFPGARRRGQAIAGVIVGSVSLILTVLLAVVAVVVYQQVHGTGVSQTGSQQSSPQQSSPQQSSPQSGGGTGADTGGSSSPSTIAELKQAIGASVTRMLSVDVSTVACDSAASMSSGSAFDCGAKLADGRWTSVRTLILYPIGSGMSYSLGIGPLLASDATPAHSSVTVDQIKEEVNGGLSSAWKSISTLTCDPVASTTPGSKFGCHVDLDDGRTGDVLIIMTPAGRYDVSVTHLPAGAGGAGDSAGSGGAGSSGSTEPDPDLSNS